MSDSLGLRDQVLLRAFGTIGPPPCPASEREAWYTRLVDTAGPATSADRLVVWLAAHKAGCAPDLDELALDPTHRAYVHGILTLERSRFVVRSSTRA